MSLNGKNILITGGTGSFGSRFVNRVLTDYSPERLVVLSRDELKQFRLRQQYPVSDYPNLRSVFGY